MKSSGRRKRSRKEFRMRILDVIQKSAMELLSPSLNNRDLTWSYADISTACEYCRFIIGGIPAPTKCATLTLQMLGDNDGIFQQWHRYAMVGCCSIARGAW